MKQRRVKITLSKLLTVKTVIKWMYRVRESIFFLNGRNVSILIKIKGRERARDEKGRNTYQSYGRTL